MQNKRKQFDISVLYVEDEEAARREVAQILQRRAREVFIARDGSEGLALFRQHKPDLVVTDIQMPVMDGLRMARTMREECGHTLIIVTTAHSDSRYMLDAIDIGVDQYVVKPVSLEKLTQALTKCAEIIENRRVEKLLHDSEVRFRAVFENSVDAIGISIKGTHVFVNPAYRALFGYPADEDLSGKPILDLIAPSERPAILERVQRRARGEDVPSIYETRGLRHDGSEFVMDVHASVYELSGSVYTLVILRDITQVKRAEEMSLGYSRDLEQLLAISREATVTTDRKALFRSFVAASRQLLKLDFSTLMLLSEDGSTLTIEDCLGFPESMVGTFSLAKGQGLATYAVTSSRPGVVQDFRTETRFEVPPVVLQRNIRSAIAVPMIIKDKAIGVLIGHTLELREFTGNEITIYQHIANQAAVALRNVINMEVLKQSEKKIRDITASLGEGLYALNREGNVTFMNPEAERLLGWTEAELLDRNIHDIIHSRRPDGAPCPLRTVRSIR